jgi:hypothetical protein
MNMSFRSCRPGVAGFALVVVSGVYLFGTSTIKPYYKVECRVQEIIGVRVFIECQIKRKQWEEKKEVKRTERNDLNYVVQESIDAT